MCTSPSPSSVHYSGTGTEKGVDYSTFVRTVNRGTMEEQQPVEEQESVASESQAEEESVPGTPLREDDPETLANFLIESLPIGKSLKVAELLMDKLQIQQESQEIPSKQDTGSNFREDIAEMEEVKNMAFNPFMSREDPQKIFGTYQDPAPAREPQRLRPRYKAQRSRRRRETASRKSVAPGGGSTFTPVQGDGRGSLPQQPPWTSSNLPGFGLGLGAQSSFSQPSHGRREELRTGDSRPAQPQPSMSQSIPVYQSVPTGPYAYQGLPYQQVPQGYFSADPNSQVPTMGGYPQPMAYGGVPQLRIPLGTLGREMGHTFVEPWRPHTRDIEIPLYSSLTGIEAQKVITSLAKQYRWECGNPIPYPYIQIQLLNAGKRLGIRERIDLIFLSLGATASKRVASVMKVYPMPFPNVQGIAYDETQLIANLEHVKRLTRGALHPEGDRKRYDREFEEIQQGRDENINEYWRRFEVAYIASSQEFSNIPEGITATRFIRGLLPFYREKMLFLNIQEMSKALDVALNLEANYVSEHGKKSSVHSLRRTLEEASDLESSKIAKAVASIMAALETKG